MSAYLKFTDKLLKGLNSSRTSSDIKEIEKIVMQMKNGSDRIRYCHNLVKDLNMLPTKMEVECKKDESKALCVRKAGNKFFVAKEYTNALKCYNESLCYAPAGSESLAIGYANRSAIYLDTGFFQFCLENIELALQNAYPERLKAKLLLRKETCMERMKTEEDSFKLYGTPEEPKLSYPANPKIPFAVDALYCKTSKARGRGIYTKRNLKPGDVVIIEEPFQAVLEREGFYSNCNYCRSTNYHNLKPCPRSTAAMFCSDECALEAWKRYHKYEYSIVHGYSEFLLMGSVHLNVRATLKTLTMVESLADLRELIDSIDVETENAFDIDFTSADERSKFRAFYALNGHAGKDSPTTNLMLTCLFACVWHIFKEFSPMKEDLESREFEDLFLNLLCKFFDICRINIYALCNYIKHENHDGSGISLLSSLLNHSCIPNVAVIPTSTKVFSYVLRPVKSGEELFADYGFEFHTYPLSERQEFLSVKYHFECKCEACRFNYPQLDKLQVKTKDLSMARFIMRIADPMYLKNLKSQSQCLMEKELICRGLANEAPNYPSQEIYLLEGRLQDILLRLIQPRTLEDIASG